VSGAPGGGHERPRSPASWGVLAFDAAVAAACAASARAAFRELFVDVPRVHEARWPGPWSTPKVAATVVLATSLAGLAAALLLVTALRDPGARRAARGVELGMLAGMAGAWFAWTADFLGTAGQFG
jgi:hypothetical protein